MYFGKLCGRYGGEGRCIEHCGGQVWRKRPLWTPRYRWKHNINIYMKEIGWEGVDWMDLAQDRYKWWAVVNAMMNLQVPSNAGNSSTSWGNVGFWRTVLSGGGSLMLHWPPLVWALRHKRATWRHEDHPYRSHLVPSYRTHLSALWRSQRQFQMLL